MSAAVIGSFPAIRVVGHTRKSCGSASLVDQGRIGEALGWPPNEPSIGRSVPPQRWAAPFLPRVEGHRRPVPFRVASRACGLPPQRSPGGQSRSQAPAAERANPRCGVQSSKGRTCLGILMYAVIIRAAAGKVKGFRGPPGIIPRGSVDLRGCGYPPPSTLAKDSGLTDPPTNTLLGHYPSVPGPVPLAARLGPAAELGLRYSGEDERGGLGLRMPCFAAND